MCSTPIDFDRPEPEFLDPKPPPVIKTVGEVRQVSRVAIRSASVGAANTYVFLTKRAFREPSRNTGG
jgi:hypothetical protein